MKQAASRIVPPLAALLALLLSSPAPAQSPQGVGRAGYEWQTNQALDGERLKRFKLELQPLSLEEWKGKALAWFEVRPEGDGAVAVSGSLGVRRLEVKKAEVEPVSEVSWTILPGSKKLPRDMTVVLTDPDSTEIECPLRDLAGTTDVVGIFLYEGGLHCFARSPG